MHLLHRFTSITIVLTLLSSFTAGQTPEAEANAVLAEARKLAWQPGESNLRQSLEKFLEAARLFQRARVPKKEMFSYLGGCMVAIPLREYKVARDLCVKSMPLYEEHGQTKELPVVLSSIANLSVQIGDRQTAITYYIRSAKIHAERGETASQASVENDLGSVYYQLGKYDEALRYLELALERRKRLGVKCDIAATLSNIGAVQIARGQWTKALNSLQQQALPLYYATPDSATLKCVIGEKYVDKSECPDNLAGTLINIGKTYYDLADFRSALCFYQRAEPLVITKQYKAALANNLGTIDYKLGNYQSAIAHFQRAMKIHADVAAEALTNIAVAQPPEDSGVVSLKEALRLRRESGNENGEAVTLNSLGEVYNRLRRPQDALVNFNRAITLFAAAGDRSGEAIALSNAMLSWRMLGNRSRAIANGKSAVDRFQELRLEVRTASGEIERTYLRTVRLAYQNLAELLIEEGQHQQAIQILSLYQAAQAFTSGKEPVDSAEVVSAQRELAVDRSLRAVSLYTLVGDDKLHILAVTRSGIKVFSHTVAANVVEQKVKEFLGVLRCADFDPRQAASEFYDLIFNSTSISDRRITLERALKTENAATLLWSLDRPLSAIPMGALYDPAAKQYLIEKYQIGVFTQNDPESLRRRPKAWLNGIGLGTSTQFTGQDPIPGAEASLAAIFGDETTRQPGILNGKTVVNDAFTMKTLEELDGRWPLVHVVSHFVFTAGEPESSFLRLGNGDRYTLAQLQQAPDVFAGVELLSVPICESAVEDADFYGKETEAFANLAQRAGARSVIASLWKVSYHVTPQLMLRFFELARAHPDWPKSELLRQAQLSLLRGEISVALESNIARGSCRSEGQSRRSFVAGRKSPFAHPYYWAAFVLYGGAR